MSLPLLLAVLMAQTPSAPRPTLPVYLAVDLPVTIGASAWVLLSEFALKTQLAPSACRTCDTDDKGNDTLNPLDRAVRDTFVWQNTAAADVASYVTAGLAPLASFGAIALDGGLEGGTRQIGPNLLVVAESMTVAMALDQIVKFAVGRERPFVHRLAAADKAGTAHPNDNFLSFFSGHTTFVFSLATAAGVIASLHGYKAAPAVWAGSGALAFATAYLRIAADKHYFTDVLTGMLVGGALGVLVPLLFHRPPVANAASAVPSNANGSAFNGALSQQATPSWTFAGTF